jgi:hypothetical protein
MSTRWSDGERRRFGSLAIAGLLEEDAGGTPPAVRASSGCAGALLEHQRDEPARVRGMVL